MILIFLRARDDDARRRRRRRRTTTTTNDDEDARRWMDGWAGAVMARRARDAGATRARVGAWMITTVGLSPIHRVRGRDAREDASRWRRRGRVPAMGGVPAAGALRPGREAEGRASRTGELGVGSGDDGGGCAITVVAVSAPSSPRLSTTRRDATRRDAREGPSRGRDATRD